MGGDIVPYFVGRGEAAVYDFKRNDVPGSTDRDRAYWRDVGTIDSFYDAHADLIATLPIFNLYNTDWPIFSRSEEHTSELQSLMRISYAVFCLKKKKKQ